MADNKIRRVATAALLAAVPVIGLAAPAAAQSGAGGSLHQSGAGGTLHQIGGAWHQSGAGGTLHQSGAGGSLHQGSVPWHEGTSGSFGSGTADAAGFDARF